MSLRARIGAVAGLAVAGVVIAIAVASYVADRSELRGQVDRSLRDVARGFATRRLAPPLPGGPRPGPVRRPPHDGDGVPPKVAPGRFGGPSGYVQIVEPNGTVRRPPDESRALPVDNATRKLARNGGPPFFRDATVDGIHLRVFATTDADGGAVQVARPLTEVDRSLDRLLVVLIVVGLGGIAVAAILGMLVARAALAPVSRFTRRTEALTADPDPSHRLEVRGRDELARLAGSFNATLDALERSVQAQRHLVADASHELRTPIATLRANIQTLEQADRLSPEDREGLRADIIEELDSLTALVADVVELARGAGTPAMADDVALDQIVESALHSARRRAPAVRFTQKLEPTLVTASPEQVERAVTNLLDNAIKWSPPDGEIEVTLREGVLSVRDQGPGFKDRDLPHVFDRFYRADDARRQPGSGLGLAIVRQAVEAHGGHAEAANDPRGGARLEVSFGRPTP
ncbi:MAG: HAMP domain-containing histidine kinase [Actinobacteria bacterium]|nr:MAG: HAMP domain-containing histidine kinase [Actinomycetota bacterium]